MIIDPHHAARELTKQMYKDGLRPLPTTTSMPRWMPGRFQLATMGRYEGEPRTELFLDAPEKQVWFPRWADIVLELWAGPIDIDPTGGEVRTAQRDSVLKVVLQSGLWQQRVVDSFDREGLKGVREALLPVIQGPPPMLIEEFEAGIKRLGQVS